MDYWHAALLGFIQGVTEFLPVSSSGHLRVLESWFGMTEPQTAFDVALHLGTLLAVLLFFRKDVAQLAVAPFRAVARARNGGGWQALSQDEGMRGVVFILVGSIPTGIIGYKLGHYLESRAMSLAFVGAMFMVNGVVLFASRLVRVRLTGTRLNRGFAGMTLVDAVLVGAVQGLAVTRGISRSGSTISTALILGVDRETAGKYSFLLSVPAIAGATLLSLKDFQDPARVDVGAAAIGALVALVTGAICLKILMSVVKRGRLHSFGWYTLVLGGALLVWYYYGADLTSWWRLRYGG